MVQAQQGKKTEATVKRIPEAAPERLRSTPWLVGALVIMSAAFLALAGLTLYQRYAKTDAERLAADVTTAWDAAKPAALTAAYDREAVLIEADGTKVVGIKAIIAAAQARGPKYSVMNVGSIAATSGGPYAMTAYRFAGDGRGSGISVIKVADGKIIRQWNFESTPVPAQPSK